MAHGKKEAVGKPCLEGGDTAMNESQNLTKPPDIADLIAFVDKVIAAWKEIGRQNFVAHPDADPDAFERQWPQLLENLFIAETVRVAKGLSVLSEDRDN
jgi:hypothetical protein